MFMSHNPTSTLKQKQLLECPQMLPESEGEKSRPQVLMQGRREKKQDALHYISSSISHDR